MTQPLTLVPSTNADLQAKVQDTAERFTRAQSCHGNPTACGCGGDCPAGGIAA